jgi:hypothetical protein
LETRKRSEITPIAKFPLFYTGKLKSSSIFSFGQENVSLSFDNTALSFGNTLYFLNKETGNHESKGRLASRNTGRTSGNGEGLAERRRGKRSGLGHTPAVLREFDGLIQAADTALAAAKPPRPEDLRKFFTRRKKDVIGFDFGNSGKTAYFAVQVENGGKKGPWGPPVSALIP